MSNFGKWTQISTLGTKKGTVLMTGNDQGPSPAFELLQILFHSHLSGSIECSLFDLALLIATEGQDEDEEADEALSNLADLVLGLSSDSFDIQPTVVIFSQEYDALGSSLGVAFRFKR